MTTVTVYVKAAYSISETTKQISIQFGSYWMYILKLPFIVKCQAFRPLRLSLTAQIFPISVWYGNSCFGVYPLLWCNFSTYTARVLGTSSIYDASFFRYPKLHVILKTKYVLWLYFLGTYLKSQRSFLIFLLASIVRIPKPLKEIMCKQATTTSL